MRYCTSNSSPCGPYSAYLALLRLWYVGEILLESLHVGSKEMTAEEIQEIEDYFLFVSRFTQACFFATVHIVDRGQKRIRDRAKMKMSVFCRKLCEAQNWSALTSATNCAYEARDDVLEVMRQEARDLTNAEFSLEKMAETMVMGLYGGETYVLLLAQYASRTKFAQHLWALRIFTKANVRHKVCTRLRAPFLAIPQLRNATNTVRDKDDFVQRYLHFKNVKLARE